METLSTTLVANLRAEICALKFDNDELRKQVSNPQLRPLKEVPNKNEWLFIRGSFGSGEPDAQLLQVKMVKVSEQDGTEIILKKKGNCYFNFNMYLHGKSWAKQVFTVIH